MGPLRRSRRVARKCTRIERLTGNRIDTACFTLIRLELAIGMALHDVARRTNRTLRFRLLRGVPSRVCHAPVARSMRVDRIIDRTGGYDLCCFTQSGSVITMLDR